MYKVLLQTYVYKYIQIALGFYTEKSHYFGKNFIKSQLFNILLKLTKKSFFNFNRKWQII